MMATGLDVKQLETSSKAYMEKHNISVFIEDALCRLLEDRPDKPAKFLSEYFDSVNRGTNTLLREFEYVKATTLNRITFVERFAEVLDARPAVSYNATEYLHLVELICPDFSRDVIVEAAVLAAQAASGPVGAPKDTNVTKYKIPAANFLACLKVCFLYLEFIELSRRAIKLASTRFPAPCFLEKTTNNLICKVSSVEERDALTKALVDALTTALADAPQHYSIPPAAALKHGVNALNAYTQENPNFFYPDCHWVYIMAVLQKTEVLQDP